MSNERRLQFQVGLVVLVAVSLGTTLVFRLAICIAIFRSIIRCSFILKRRAGSIPRHP